MLVAASFFAITTRRIKVDPDEYIRDIMFTSLMHLFFDVRSDTSLFEKMRSLSYDTIDVHKFACDTDRRKKRATDTLLAILRQHTSSCDDIQQQRTARHRCFLRALVETDAEPVEDDTILGNLIYMVDLGAYDVANLTRWLFKMLIDHPNLIEQLRDQSAGDTTDGRNELARRVVKEALRLEQSEFLLRRSTHDI